MLVQFSDAVSVSASFASSDASRPCARVLSILMKNPNAARRWSQPGASAALKQFWKSIWFVVLRSN